MKVRVTVMLKDGVLDPQGRAIAHALHVLDFAEVGEVRAGRVIEIELDEADAGRARSRATAMGERLLANAVIETFSVEVMP